ncbi:hypothetical protein CAEBREN_06262 [Caenorhabditis brenneri]|uniref:RNA-directed DNA polymerase n=1 Tax=Caenorhabditis brenneri TaxID=135651 RepID=G0PKP3_CAEBE|nr:hypothetical protein CAEBREN_06262 [Caenorhabditis brenneri]
MEAVNDRLASLELDQRRTKAWPVFDPKSESFRSFVETVNEYCNAQNRTEPDARRALPLMLNAEWKQAYRDNVLAADDWRTSINKLRDAMLTPQKQSEFTAKLTTVAQGSMNVADFSRKVREISYNAVPNNEEAREIVALSTFLRGLNPTLRTEVRKQSPTTFRDAVRIASTFETVNAMENTEESVVNAVKDLTESVNRLQLQQNSSRRWNKRPRYPNQWTNRNGFAQHRFQGNQENNPRQPPNNRFNRFNRFGNQQRRGNSDRRPFSQRRMMTNFLFAAIVMTIFNSVSAETFFDCSKSIGGIFIAPPMKANCSERLEEDMVVAREVKLWLLDKHDEDPIDAYRCTKEVYRRCTTSFLFLSSYNQTLKKIEAVEQNSCKQMISGRGIEGKLLSSLDHITSTTELEMEPWPERSWASTICTDVARYVLQKGSVSKFGESIITPLMINTNACRIEEGLCGNEAALVIWTPPPDTGCYPRDIGSFAAQIINTTVLIPQMQAAFHMLQIETPKEIQKCFKETVFSTTSSVFISIKEPDPSQRRRRGDGSSEAIDLLDRFLDQRKHLPDLSLRQFPHGLAVLPTLIRKFNITEYELERQMRLHPTKDISLGIIHTLVVAEIEDNKKKGKSFENLAFADIDADYSPTEAESWISLSKILFREVKSNELLGEDQISPSPVAAQSYVGSEAHTNFLQQQYDRREDVRRNLSTTSQNAKHQFNAELMQKNMRENFVVMARSLCSTNNKLLDIWNALLRLDASSGIRSILQRMDIEAKFVGRSTLLVSQCTPIEAAEIVYSKNLGNNCYSQTPILTKENETFFIIAGSRDVTKTSKMIPCDEVEKDWIESSNGSIFLDGKTEFVENLPFLPKMNVSLSTVNFHAKDILANAMDSSFPLSLAISFGQNLQSLQTQKKNLLKPTNIDKFLGSKVKTLEDVARLGGYTFDKATETIVETAKDVKDFYREYLISVGTMITGILVFIGIIYTIVRICIQSSFPVFHVKFWKTDEVEMSTRVNHLDATAPDDYDEAVKPFLPRLPPLMTYLPIVMSLICAVSSTSLPFVPITIKDRYVVALWDTGSSISYIRYRTLNYLNETSHIIKTPNQRAFAANGTSFSFLGYVILPVKLGETSLEMKFLVSEDKDCPSNVLIGYDFLSLLEEKGISTTILPGKKKLIVGNAIVPLVKQGHKIYQQTSRTVNVISTENTILKPNSRKQLRITFDSDQPIHLKPNKSSQVQFEECVINPWIGNSADVILENRGPHVFHINDGELLGCATIVKLPLGSTMNSADSAEHDLELGAPEADWSQKLPQLPKSEAAFKEEIHVNETALSPGNRKKLIDLILDQKKAFFNEDGEMGHFTGPIQHSIKLINPLPRPRKTRIPYGKREEINRQVEELLKQGIIEVSNSTFTSPIVLVKKKDSTFRFTVDYRLLNAVSEKRNYQIPNITELLDLATGSFIYSSFDFVQGFFQIDLKKEDRYLTAFATDEETYQFQRMPMGVSGAPFTFQQVSRFLQKTTKVRMFAYLDDLLLVSSSEEEHLEDIKKLLENIIRNGLKLKLSKCVFARKELKFLGYLIGETGLKPNPSKTFVIQNFPIPESVTAVRSFIGLVGYFRRFIRNFAGIAAPLHNLTEKDVPFLWTDIHQKAFDELKTALINPPILSGPDLTKPYILETDASTIAIAAVLLQKNNEGLLNVISFASRKLSKAESRYPPIEGEALAVLFGLQHYRQYLLGNHTLVVTDHQPLTSLLKRKNLEGRLLKYQIMIQEFDIEIRYRPGRRNVVADALSRYLPKSTEMSQEAVLAVQIGDNTSVVTLEEVKDAQKSCKWIVEAMSALNDLEDQSRRKEAWEKRFQVKDGTLRQKSTKNSLLPFVLPAEHPLTARIVSRFHQSHCSHLGSEKTLEMIKRMFNWTNMKTQVTTQINQCTQCRKRKIDRHKTTKEPMGPVKTFQEPVIHWHIDHCGPLPVTEKGNRYILVFRDPFTKYLITAAVKTQSAEETCETFIEKIIAVHGTPKSITTDNGASFCSSLFKNTLMKLGIKHELSVPYHHQSNGLVERSNRTLEETLATFVNGSQSDWDEYLSLVTFSVNCTMSKTTGLSPFEAMYGRLPRCTETNLLKYEFNFGDDYQERLNRRLKEIWKKLGENQRIRKTTAQSRVKQKEIQVGDQVLIQGQKPSNKLMMRFSGPYAVKEVDGKNISVEVKGRIRQRHKDDVQLLEKGLPSSEVGVASQAEEGSEQKMVRRSERLAKKRCI